LSDHGPISTEALHSQVLESFLSGILGVDWENRIVYLNQALASRLGVQSADWIGKPVEGLGGIIEPRLTHAEAFRSGLIWQHEAETFKSREVEFVEAERVLHFREDSYPLRDPSGAIHGRLFVYTDISRAKAIDRMKTEFLAIASHELRTPMTSIKGSIDLILSGFAGDISGETHELLDIAQKGCDRLVRLINDILDLSKIEAGQIKLKLAPMDITEVVHISMRGVKSLADQSKVSLRLYHPEHLPEVEVDKDRMVQVVTNLLSNAIKFSPADSEVRVEIQTGDGWIECCVGDQGCGIAPEDAGRVFGKFQQFGEKKKGGTGLGLAITQALVLEHRGKIWLESRVNEGSKFIFRLPLGKG